jgi:hypothetical protein
MVAKYCTSWPRTRRRFWIKAAPAAPLARRQRRAVPLSGPPVARRATPSGTQIKTLARRAVPMAIGYRRPFDLAATHQDHGACEDDGLD